MNVLTVFSTKQGIQYDEEAAVRSFAAIARLLAIAASLRGTARGLPGRAGGWFRSLRLEWRRP